MAPWLELYNLTVACYLVRLYLYCYKWTNLSSIIPYFMYHLERVPGGLSWMNLYPKYSAFFISIIKELAIFFINLPFFSLCNKWQHFIPFFFYAVNFCLGTLCLLLCCDKFPRDITPFAPTPPLNSPLGKKWAKLGDLVNPGLVATIRD